MSMASERKAASASTSDHQPMPTTATRSLRVSAGPGFGCGLDDGLAMFGRSALENIARGFGLRGHEIRDVSVIPKLFADFAAQGESEMWNIQISDKVTAPVIRQTIKRGHAHDRDSRPSAVAVVPGAGGARVLPRQATARHTRSCCGHDQLMQNPAGSSHRRTVSPQGRPVGEWPPRPAYPPSQ